MDGESQGIEWGGSEGRKRGGGGGGEEVAEEVELLVGDESNEAVVGDDMEVVRATGVGDIDGWREPMSEDDDPLFLSHGDVSGVVVLVIVDIVVLAMKFGGGGKNEGIN
ncbi:hypothetical protein CVIRNUC_003238 [Coccomyxa viridis]|uniref:Uncharacterized protein n=1 Tax=Coccomyxa viridis TaxID=1274662 RepID=A0AAV1HYG9_9CHLO|nr:hypothetical protein CVIRNUC_003238 [Coccomyxa viridis]